MIWSYAMLKNNGMEYGLVLGLDPSGHNEWNGACEEK